MDNSDKNSHGMGQNLSKAVRNVDTSIHCKNSPPAPIQNGDTAVRNADVQNKETVTQNGDTVVQNGDTVEWNPDSTLRSKDALVRNGDTVVAAGKGNSIGPKGIGVPTDE